MFFCSKVRADAFKEKIRIVKIKMVWISFVKKKKHSDFLTSHNSVSVDARKRLNRLNDSVQP